MRWGRNFGGFRCVLRRRNLPDFSSTSSSINAYYVHAGLFIILFRMFSRAQKFRVPPVPHFLWKDATGSDIQGHQPGLPELNTSWSNRFDGSLRENELSIKSRSKPSECLETSSFGWGNLVAQPDWLLSKSFPETETLKPICLSHT